MTTIRASSFTITFQSCILELILRISFIEFLCHLLKRLNLLFTCWIFLIYSQSNHIFSFESTLFLTYREKAKIIIIKKKTGRGPSVSLPISGNIQNESNISPFLRFYLSPLVQAHRKFLKSYGSCWIGTPMTYRNSYQDNLLSIQVPLDHQNEGREMSHAPRKFSHGPKKKEDQLANKYISR